jgi:transcriptional regulator with XRE-family HTH domain
VTIATLSRIERGVTNPKWMSVRAIARALGVGMGELSAAVETEEARATLHADSRPRSTPAPAN